MVGRVAGLQLCCTWRPHAGDSLLPLLLGDGEDVALVLFDGFIHLDLPGLFGFLLREGSALSELLHFW